MSVAAPTLLLGPDVAVSVAAPVEIPSPTIDDSVAADEVTPELLFISGIPDSVAITVEMISVSVLMFASVAGTAASVATAVEITIGLRFVGAVSVSFSPTAIHVPLSQKQSEKLGGVPISHHGVMIR